MLVPGTERVRERKLDWRSLDLLVSSQAPRQRSDRRLSVKMWAGRNTQWHYNKVIQPISRTEIIYVLFFLSTLKRALDVFKLRKWFFKNVFAVFGKLCVCRQRCVLIWTAISYWVKKKKIRATPKVRNSPSELKWAGERSTLARYDVHLTYVGQWFSHCKLRVRPWHWSSRGPVQF